MLRTIVRSVMFSLFRLARLARRSRPGQLDGEVGAFPWRAGDPDRPSERRHDPLHDPQPEPEAPLLLRDGHPFEALEDATLVLARDPDAVVAHREARDAAP